MQRIILFILGREHAQLKHVFQHLTESKDESCTVPRTRPRQWAAILRGPVAFAIDVVGGTIRGCVEPASGREADDLSARSRGDDSAMATGVRCGLSLQWAGQQGPTDTRGVAAIIGMDPPRDPPWLEWLVAELVRRAGALHRGHRKGRGHPACGEQGRAAEGHPPEGDAHRR